MTRRDYLNDPNAPQANSIAVAVSAFIQDDKGRILMIRRTDNNLYSIPGGQVEPGETITGAAQRETKEETGIIIDIVGLVGLYSDPGHVIEYDDGEVRQEFSICFYGTPAGGELETSNESSEASWVQLEEIDGLAIHESIRLRIRHAMAKCELPYYT